MATCTSNSSSSTTSLKIPSILDQTPNQPTLKRKILLPRLPSAIPKISDPRELAKKQRVTALSKETKKKEQKQKPKKKKTEKRRIYREFGQVEIIIHPRRFNQIYDSQAIPHRRWPPPANQPTNQPTNHAFISRAF